MNSTARSTTEIRLLATDVVRAQNAVCEARRENIEDKLSSLAEAVAANAAGIAALTTTVTSLSTSMTVLQGRPAVWAAIGAAIPVILGVIALYLK